MKYQLYHSHFTGSQIIKDALQLCGAETQLIFVEYAKVARGKESKLKKVNPLCRLPTLILPNKKVMTESGAILLHLAHQFPKLKLVPKSGTEESDLFFRMLFILTGEIYPTFTYADDPQDWVQAVASREPFQKRVIQFRKELWLEFEKMMSRSGPWALGKNFSAIDLYLASMSLWRPRMEWFQKNCPRITRSAKKTRARLGRDE